MPAAFFGVTFMLSPDQNPALRIVKVVGLGADLLGVAAVMLLVWLRLWFGGPKWIVSVLLVLFNRTYGYLLIGVSVLCLFVSVELILG